MVHKAHTQENKTTNSLMDQTHSLNETIDNHFVAQKHVIICITLCAKTAQLSFYLDCLCLWVAVTVEFTFVVTLTLTQVTLDSHMFGH